MWQTEVRNVGLNMKLIYPYKDLRIKVVQLESDIISLLFIYYKIKGDRRLILRFKSQQFVATKGLLQNQ